MKLKDIIAAIEARQADHFSFESFGKGLGLASSYVPSWGPEPSKEAVKRAGQMLTWVADDPKPEEYADASAGLKRFKLPDGMEVPKNTLMVFRNVITTNAEDRDGDVLLTEGAEIDPMMPLLWQHNSAIPIGKMMGVDKHTEKLLRVFSALLDLNALTEDTAKMIEAGVLRISHGFIPKQFKEREEESKRVPWNGFEIASFEIMEESTVSVPSNRGAIIDMFSRDAFKSPEMRSIGKSMFDNRPDKIWAGFKAENTAILKDLEPHASDAIDGPISKDADRCDIVVVTEKVGDYEYTISGTPDAIQSIQSIKELAKAQSDLRWIELEIRENGTVWFDGKEIVPSDEKGGREISKANLQLLRDVVEDLTELKSDADLTRSHVALLNKSIGQLQALIDKNTEDPADDEPGKNEPPPSNVSEDTTEPYAVALHFAMFGADADQLEKLTEAIQARRDVEESYELGDQMRATV